MSCFMFKVYITKVTNNKHNNLLCSERTLLSCLTVHLFTTAQYINNIK